MEEQELINDAGESTSVSIKETLEQRGTRYGAFATHSAISAALRTNVFKGLQANPQAAKLTPYMEEAIIMICHKLGRISNGDPAYDDSWRDIAGYAQLVVDELNKLKEA